MNDSPYRTPNADELSEPLKTVESTSWTRVALRVFVVVGIVVVAIAMLLPNVRSSTGAAHRSQCSNNLKQIGLALRNYADEYGTLPPAYTVDADGKRLHSWRTLILPFLEQGQLYETIDLSKPWDDPVNAPAAKTRVSAYQCRSAAIPATQTTYLAAVTATSCLNAEPKKPSDITDGANETVMVIEVGAEQAVPWMSPEDADEDLVLSLGDKSKLPHPGGMQAALADGSVRFLEGDLPAAQRRALISIADNDEIEAEGAD